eukprot:1162098-Pelagomonas_calceolata.AAC.12
MRCMEEQKKTTFNESLLVALGVIVFLAVKLWIQERPVLPRQSFTDFSTWTSKKIAISCMQTENSSPKESFTLQEGLAIQDDQTIAGVRLHNLPYITVVIPHP